MERILSIAGILLSLAHGLKSLNAMIQRRSRLISILISKRIESALMILALNAQLGGSHE